MNLFKNSKKSIGTIGKIILNEEKEIEIQNRKILVVFRKYESGIERVNSYFCDKDRMGLTLQNRLLKKEIEELKKKLKTYEI